MKQSPLPILFLALVVLLTGTLVASAQSRQRRQGVLAIGGSNQREAYSGRGRYVLISGRDNRISVSGSVTTLRVTGNNNYVRVNSVRQIEVAGRNNEITFSRAASGAMPRIFQRPGNQVIRAK